MRKLDVENEGIPAVYGQTSPPTRRGIRSRTSSRREPRTISQRWTTTHPSYSSSSTIASTTARRPTSCATRYRTVSIKPSFSLPMQPPSQVLSETSWLFIFGQARHSGFYLNLHS